MEYSYIAVLPLKDLNTSFNSAQNNEPAERLSFQHFTTRWKQTITKKPHKLNGPLPYHEEPKIIIVMLTTTKLVAPRLAATLSLLL